MDENGFTSDLGWIQGTLERGEGTEASRPWTLEEDDNDNADADADDCNYTIKIFVWDGVSANPKSLSEVAQKNFSVN